MDAASWAAAGTWVTVAIYFAILFYAIRQVGEAKRLRRAQIRPFVIVDTEPGFIVYLTIENIGTTLARNVQFAFEPRIKTATEDSEILEAPLLQDGVESFPPRKKYRIFFDSFNDRLNMNELPMTYQVTVNYQDEDGHNYVDRYTLNLRAYLNTELREKGVPELVDEMRRIHKDLDKLAAHVRGLLTVARKTDKGQGQGGANYRSES